MNTYKDNFPDYSQVLKHRRGHRYGYWKFHERLNEWALDNTKILRLIANGTIAIDNSVAENEEFRILHREMLVLFITDYAGWATLTIVSEKEPVRNLDELEQRLRGVIIGNDAPSGIIRHTVASDLFVELSRTHFILMHQPLLHESAMIAKLDAIPNGKEYKVLWSLEHAEFFVGPEKKPIMAYNQSEIIALLFQLTERIDCTPIENIEELRHILMLAYTRNSIFFCQRMPTEILDDPRGKVEAVGAVVPAGAAGAVKARAALFIPSREYMVFCSIYFHALHRRIYMYDTCTKKKVPPLKSNLQHFCEHDVKLSSESFEEAYKRACEEAYIFPGDLEWFKYQNPDMPPQIGSILDCYRKDMAKRYYTNYRITQDVVMAAVQQPTHSGHASRIFIINLLDQYLRIHYKIPWKDGIVIQNAGIESNEKKLFSKKSAPFLVQVCSRLWVYCDKVVYMTDDIYEAIAFWMHLLKDRYGGKLFGVNLNEFIDKVLKQ